MVSKTAVLALAASSIVSAQTFTDCNPLKKTCPSDPAFGKDNINCDFTKGACDTFAELPGTTLKYSDKGAVFSISTEDEAPTIRTGRYILFGKVEVVVQAAAGPGVVTSSVLQSDDLDEIDWEWVGGDNAQAQTNYFSKGDTTTYDRGAFHPVTNPTGQFHKYGVEWTSQAVTWLIDDVPVRTLTAAQANGGATLPQTPMQVKLGTWVAGRKSAPQGTVEWAGGLADFDKAPFLGYYQSISIVDYAGGDGPSDKSIKEYIYSDHSGTWQSINVVEGIPEDPVSAAHSSSTASATKTAGSSSSQTGAPSKTADGKSTLVTVPTPNAGSGSSSNSTGPAPTGSNGIAKPSTISSSSGTRGSAAVFGILATGAGALLAQYFL